MILGATPPPARYFGYRTHVAYRDFAGVSELVLATNGLDLTSWAFEAHRGDADVSLEPMAVVTSADAGIERGVHALLEGAGFLPTEIEDDRIGADITRLGLGDADDQLAMIHRAAVFDDPAAEAAYRDAPGLVVLRLTPSAPLASPEPHAWPGLPPVGSGTDESAWAASLADLEAAILASAPAHVATDQPLKRGGATPLACLANGTVCGDLSSRIFALTDLFELPDGGFAVAFGTNHERTGKALYSSFAAQAFAHNVGLDAIDSVQMVGSASGFLPDDPLADDLYAVYLARDCALFPGAACMEIPEGCPGVEPGGRLYGASRLYVDPLTGVAPDEAEVLADRLLVFTPAGP